MSRARATNDGSSKQESHPGTLRGTSTYGVQLPEPPRNLSEEGPKNAQIEDGYGVRQPIPDQNKPEAESHPTRGTTFLAQRALFGL